MWLVGGWEEHMCIVCDQRIGRRAFLRFGAGLAAVAAFGGPVLAASGPPTSLTADQALGKLKEGNQRYVSSPQACASDLAKARADVAQHQAPWATILSCADSRVPPELIFGGRNVGELFIARNAGNMADTATLGTIEYGAAALGVPLIVVLGHGRCGAVAAACEVVEKNTKYPGSIGPMLEPIIPAALAAKGKSGDFVDNAIRENARRTAARIVSASNIVADLVSKGRVKVVAAHYSLDDGRVDFLT
jgi:carbonic anhydrase